MIHNAITNEIMKKINFLAIVFFIHLFFMSSGFAAKSNYFDEGKTLFDKKEFEKSKISFERDLVFNPKSEMSYLYLAKIFKQNKNEEEQEINLDNVLLLNPQNEEAIYMLTILKIKQSDYKKAKELKEKFALICESFCSKKSEIEKSFNKLTP